MARPLRYVLLTALFLGLLPLSAYAAAWLQPKGKGLVIGNLQQYVACNYWDQQSQLQDSGACFNQFSLSPYVEYGVLSRLTAVVSPNFNSFNQGNQSVPFGFENIFLAGRYLLWEKEWSALSVQLGYNQPIRTSTFGNPLIPTSAFVLINRQSYLDARLLYGTGGIFAPAKENTWYADFETAFQPNFTGAADEFHLKMMLGLKTRDGRLIFEVQEFNALRFNNPKNDTFPNYNLFTIMPNVIYWYKENVAAIQLGVYQDFFGTNIGRGTTPFVSLWWRF